MYSPKAFSSISQKEIIKRVRREGFEPIAITNAPGFVYHRHTHPETKLLVFLKGTPPAAPSSGREKFSRFA